MIELNALQLIGLVMFVASGAACFGLAVGVVFMRREERHSREWTGI